MIQSVSALGFIGPKHPQAAGGLFIRSNGFFNELCVGLKCGRGACYVQQLKNLNAPFSLGVQLKDCTYDAFDELEQK